MNVVKMDLHIPCFPQSNLNLFHTCATILQFLHFNNLPLSFLSSLMSLTLFSENQTKLFIYCDKHAQLIYTLSTLFL